MISQTVLILAEPFGDDLDAERVAAAIGRGLGADSNRRFGCDLCPIVADPATTVQPAGAGRTLLDALDFDRRMLASRAIVIARRRLDDLTLADTLAFEAATRARQSGVPAYAVTAENALDPFEARIVDLQVILQADGSRTLGDAGRKLAALV